MKYTILIMLASFLFACNPSVSFNSMMHLKKGQSLQENLEKVDSPWREDPVDYKIEGVKYTIVVHKMLSETVGNMGNSSFSKDAYGNNINSSTRRNMYVNYYLIFEEDKLFAWGFMYELSRDPELQEFLAKSYKYVY